MTDDLHELRKSLDMIKKTIDEQAARRPELISLMYLIDKLFELIEGQTKEIAVLEKYANFLVEPGDN